MIDIQILQLHRFFFFMYLGNYFLHKHCNTCIISAHVYISIVFISGVCNSGRIIYFCKYCILPNICSYSTVYIAILKNLTSLKGNSPFVLCCKCCLSFLHIICSFCPRMATTGINVCPRPNHLCLGSN